MAAGNASLLLDQLLRNVLSLIDHPLIGTEPAPSIDRLSKPPQDLSPQYL
jgi:hypothetical protein